MPRSMFPSVRSGIGGNDDFGRSYRRSPDGRSDRTDLYARPGPQFCIPRWRASLATHCGVTDGIVDRQGRVDGRSPPPQGHPRVASGFGVTRSVVDQGD